MPSSSYGFTITFHSETRAGDTAVESPARTSVAREWPKALNTEHGGGELLDASLGYHVTEIKSQATIVGLHVDFGECQVTRIHLRLDHMLGGKVELLLPDRSGRRGREHYRPGGAIYRVCDRQALTQLEQWRAYIAARAFAADVIRVALESCGL